MSVYLPPIRYLAEAERLLVDRGGSAPGIWARSAAALARVALEEKMHEVLAEKAPGSQGAKARCRLLCLSHVHPDPDLAKEINYTWVALSRATHEYGYELPPTERELRSWLEVVRRFVAAGS